MKSHHLSQDEAARRLQQSWHKLCAQRNIIVALGFSIWWASYKRRCRDQWEPVDEAFDRIARRVLNTGGLRGDGWAYIDHLELAGFD